MLKVSLDEGYAFDILSILMLKWASPPANCTPEEFKKIGDSMCKLMDEIIEQIGRDQTYIIVQSNEFQSLLEANKRTYKLVDKVRAEKDGLAKQVDDANMERFRWKSALQSRFFGSMPAEVKSRL